MHRVREKGTNLHLLLATSSGGYGSSKNVWSEKVQRGHADDEPENTAGLIDQSTTGGPIGNELQDAKQGMDGQAREKYAHEMKRDFGRENRPEGLNPYGKHSDSKRDAEDMLTSRYVDTRGRDYEGSTSMDEA